MNDGCGRAETKWNPHLDSTTGEVVDSSLKGVHIHHVEVPEPLGGQGEGQSTPPALKPPASDPGTVELREALERDLDEVCADLGDQEIAVLGVLARRLLAGQRAYGRLDLANDRRDFRRERAEELADAMVYDAVHEVAATLRGGGS